MQRLIIQCPVCGHIDANWPADCFSEGRHEHACTECLSQFVATRSGNTVVTRRFALGEKPAFPRPSRVDANGDRIHTRD